MATDSSSQGLLPSEALTGRKKKSELEVFVLNFWLDRACLSG
jgi:hypothetical protein